MTTSTETLERALVQDLGGLGERLVDDRLVRDLYRALTNHALYKDGGHVSLSWQRAEEILNTARAGQALPPVEGLAQSGGEGEQTQRAQATLQELGWDARPLDTSRHDDRHDTQPEHAPPTDHTPPEWEREAHAEADANRNQPKKL
jgi:hypothetical protein